MSLDAGDTQADEFQDAVQLMIYSQRFRIPIGFYNGLEEPFSAWKSIESPSQLKKKEGFAMSALLEP